MNIKKVLAGSLAALTAGTTLALGAFGQLNTYVKTDTNAITSPIIVIGNPAQPSAQFAKDVLGAADIAAAVAGYATTTTQVAGATTTSVSNGVAVETSGTKMYLGDMATKSGLKTTLTRLDLPSILASGTITLTGALSGTINYDQYIGLGSGSLASFGTSGGDLTDPALILALNSTASGPTYNLTVTFNKQLNIGHGDVRGKTKLAIFGGEYTVGSQSEYTATSKQLVLLGSSNSEIFTVGDEKSITIAGTAHTVKLLGVSDTTTAVISVDGTTQEINEGSTYTIASVSVFADSIFYYGSGATNHQAKLSFGAQKITLKDGESVKVGNEDTSIDGTLVSLSGNLSKITIAVTGKDSSNDYIKAGNSWADPVFGSFKTAFGGITTGATDKITIDNSGNSAMIVTFTDYRGNTKQVQWVQAPSTAPFKPELNVTSNRQIVVLENQDVPVGSYVVLAPSQESDFGHLFEYTTASSINASGGYVELKDVMLGTTQRIYLDSAQQTSAAQFYVDGQLYNVNVTTTGVKNARFTWGAGASFTSAGTLTTVYPLIRMQRGGYITFVTNVTLTESTTYELPTNSSFLFNSQSVGAVRTYGRLSYWVNDVNVSSISTAGLTQGISNAKNFTSPALLIFEEKSKDTTNTEVKDAIIVSASDGSGSGIDIQIGSTDYAFTATNAYSGTLQSDNSVTHYYDRYGTFVKYDSDSQGMIEITYPDDQATANLAFGSNPTFTTAGGGATVETAVKIKSPVAKLASEINTAALTGDLILVGGPCANALVATLAETAANNIPTCSGWTLTTGLIAEVTNAFGSGKKALVVAGTNADDTRSLAARVMQGTLSFRA